MARKLHCKAANSMSSKNSPSVQRERSEGAPCSSCKQGWINLQINQFHKTPWQKVRKGDFFLFGMEINGCIGLHSTVQKAWISGSGCLLHSIKDLHICQLLTLKRLTVHLDFIQFGANLNLLSFACWTAEIRMNCSKATWCSSFKSRIRKLLQKDFSLPSVQMKLSCPSPWASLPPAAAREALPFSILLWRQSFLSAAVLGQPTPPQDTSLSSDLHLDSQQRETYSKRFSWPNYKAGFCFLPL